MIKKGMHEEMIKRQCMEGETTYHHALFSRSICASLYTYEFYIFDFTSNRTRI
uniref:Uncharacterized protein n=1 Tax=Oryza brachyantha TaxID=4533 RepID=J3LYD7_ORYBR